MKQSGKLGLNLPEDDDFFDVEHQNENMRKIDEKIADVENLSEHINDKKLHVTEQEKQTWNDKQDKVEGKGLSTNDFTDEDKNKLNDMVIPKEITGTLAAEETCITLTDDSINEDSTIDIYTSVYGVSPKAIEVAEGNITMTFKAQSEDIGVKVVVK